MSPELENEINTVIWKAIANLTNALRDGPPVSDNVFVCNQVSQMICSLTHEVAIFIRAALESRFQEEASACARQMAINAVDRLIQG